MGVRMPTVPLRRIKNNEAGDRLMLLIGHLTFAITGPRLIDRPLQNKPCRGPGASRCYRANTEQRVAAFLFKGPSFTVRFFWLVTIYFNVKPAFFELNCLNYTKAHIERIRQLLKQQRLLVRIVTLMFVFRQPL